MDFGKLFSAKAQVSRFFANHPKFLASLKEVNSKGFVEGQEIAIAVRYPDGTEVKTGIKLKDSDLPLFETLKDFTK